jgi:hypothetical protein
MTPLHFLFYQCRVRDTLLIPSSPVAMLRINNEVAYYCGLHSHTQYRQFTVAVNNCQINNVDFQRNSKHCVSTSRIYFLDLLNIKFH